MSIDLITVVAALACVGSVFTGAFLMLSRRHPTIDGPLWWSIAGALGSLGYIALALRGQLPNFLTIAVANTAISAAVSLSWVGVRSFLGLPVPRKQVYLSIAAIFVLHWSFDALWPSVLGRYIVFCGYGVVFSMLTLLDLRRYTRIHAKHPGLGTLMVLTWFELGSFTGMLFYVIFKSQVTVLTGAAEQVRSLILIFLFAVAVRLAVYQAMVTARLQMQSDRDRQLLEDREADLQDLIDNLNAGVLVFKPDQTLVTVNHAARVFFGWADKAHLGKAVGPQGVFSRMIDESGHAIPISQAPFFKVLANSQPVRDMVIGFVPAMGERTRWALCNAFPENDLTGGLRHVVITFVDLTSVRESQNRQEALRQQLAQSQKMEALGTLAGGVAHDFNNILAAILGNADLARQDLPRGAPARESLHEISTAARRGRELVRQIMAFSRQQPLERKPISVCSVVNEAASLLKAALPPNVELTVHCPPARLQIEADATQLGQVLLNLGTNAVHAIGKEQGKISVTLRNLLPDDPLVPQDLRVPVPEHDAWVAWIQVLDTGTGMDEVTRARIFEPFFTTKVVGKGTGLGLPVALGIVQSHGGVITVESEIGQGSAFNVFLPARLLEAKSSNAGTMVQNETEGAPDPKPLDSAEEDEMTTDSAPSAGRVLYLDDDDTLVFLVRRLLQRRGYDVTAFCDQQEAIEAIRGNPTGFDVLLTDYNMPGMSGIDVAKEVLAINPSMTIAVASGYINEELEQKAAAVGVTEVVFKTDAIEAFCDVVARLVAKGKPAA